MFNTFAITGEKSPLNQHEKEPFKIYIKIPKKDRFYICIRIYIYAFFSKYIYKKHLH